MSAYSNRARSAAVEARASVVDVFWFAGMSCDGCSIALTGAGHPTLEKVLRGGAGLPAVALHHPLFAVESGSAFLEPHRRALRGEHRNPYILVLEGSATNEALAGPGYWAALGSGTLSGSDGRFVDGVRQPLATMEWITALAPGATAAIAVGTCAAWGGVPAAFGSVTGAMSLADLLGSGYRSESGLPVINIPGCSPVGDNIMETLAAVLLELAGLGPSLELDELGRPAWLFTETAHRRCNQVGYYEVGTFATHPGDGGCLAELGCWGPVVQCNITTRGAINGIGGCMSTGGACIGCTMPGFPDSFSAYPGAPASLPMPADAAASARALHPLPLFDGGGLRTVVVGGMQAAAPDRSGWSFAGVSPPEDDLDVPFFDLWRVRPDPADTRAAAPAPRGAVDVSGGS